MIRLSTLLVLILAACSGIDAATAEVKIGLTISTTGPAASLGIPVRNSISLFPTEAGGEKIRWIVLDDASDTAKGVSNARKLIAEENVDAVIGSSTTPVSLALVEVASETRVPFISVASSPRIVLPMDEKRAWMFKTPQHDFVMADAIAEHMAKSGAKTAALVTFGDSYGDGWLAEMTRALEKAGIKLVATERYARTDSSVTGQVLKVIAANPDAVMIAASGTPAALPQKTLRERGYKKPIYQNHGVANTDFLRVGGKDLEGTFVPTGPMLVAAQLPDSNPTKSIALDYVKRYEDTWGPGSVATFGAHAMDAALLLEKAIPVALKNAKPGTPEFRAALRDALETLKNVPVTHGVVNMSKDDHNGFDNRARVMVVIENGKWKLLQ
ncbi:amino acid/amide ABC transporter substrate-binding protein (HAAT family) [Pseudorhodoplanes sinuspersici]|uniref:ABC transporter substrate-binding protein n=1 Tax=Pseudorhodoplanes sinuspersici TaxID=1235591 RepID=UPI000FF85BD0|nr:ABC transporter substrate-binding protein [Pseudorhodoplanes sinuspersici]RKE68229.1 amino acid/amide ABC transporter substrate-binding protein (HAAT family) [Pseudorhodoplanes sinuspersici]